jgi:hypothetical protein
VDVALVALFGNFSDDDLGPGGDFSWLLELELLIPQDLGGKLFLG